MFVDMTNILGLPLTVVLQAPQNQNGMHSKVKWRGGGGCSYQGPQAYTSVLQHKDSEFLTQPNLDLNLSSS